MLSILLYWYFSLSLCFLRFLILERIGPLSAASTAVPSLAADGGSAPAPSQTLCAAYPARLCYHDLFRPGCGAGNNTTVLTLLLLPGVWPSVASDVFGPISSDHRATPNRPKITDMT